MFVRSIAHLDKKLFLLTVCHEMFNVWYVSPDLICIAPIAPRCPAYKSSSSSSLACFSWVERSNYSSRMPRVHLRWESTSTINVWSILFLVQIYRCLLPSFLASAVSSKGKTNIIYEMLMYLVYPLFFSYYVCMYVCCVFLILIIFIT